MRVSWRGLLALSLLAGFFVLAVGIVLGLLGVTVWLFADHHGSAAIKVALAAGFMVAAAVAAVRTALAARPAPRGAPLTRADQPELWREIDELAVLAGTRTPDDVRLTPDVNAGVWEEPNLLGLRAGPRHLEIGLPLLAGLSAGELRAVLAHELGHYGGGHTRLSSMTYRAKVALQLTVTNMNPSLFRWVLRRYARLYALVAASANRRQELEADATAVAAAGRATAQSALRTVPALDHAWDAYQAGYLGLAQLAARTPELLSGFHSFLNDPDRRTALTAKADELIDAAPRSVFDSHPPVRARVAAMERLADPGVAADDRPAWTLLTDSASALPGLERQLLAGDLGPRADWPTIVRLAGAELSRRGAALLAKAGKDSGCAPDGSIGGVLDALERGELLALARPALNPALDSARVPAAAVNVITEYLADAVAAALAGTGRAVHEVNWGGPAVLMLDGAELDAEALVAPAVKDRANVPAVRARLVELGVPLEYGVEAAAETAGAVLAVLNSVKLADTRFNVLVCHGGLLLAGTDIRLAGRSADQLRELPGTIWVASRTVTSGRVRPRPTGWQLTITLDDGRELALRSSVQTLEAEGQDQAFTALLELIGSRMVK